VERKMKRIEEQSYYEILEVSSNATVKEIQRAYEHAQETYHRDSLAIYSLFSEEEVNQIQAAIEEAYRGLIDEALRRSYDQSLLRVSGGPKGERPPEVQRISREKETSLSFTALSVNAEDEIYRGKTLRQIRERIGIDLKTISAETKINTKILEWIEEEVLEKLPAAVYLRGFLKSYAQSLGLDPQKVVEGYFHFLSENRKDNSSPHPFG
jgi:flagellar biosynthesis protein FlhG